jgi:hypothetical protein
MAGKQLADAADTARSFAGAPSISREQLIEHLNEDLAREYQAVIAYVVYSQVLKGAQYTDLSRIDAPWGLGCDSRW